MIPNKEMNPIWRSNMLWPCNTAGLWRVLMWNLTHPSCQALYWSFLKLVTVTSCGKPESDSMHLWLATQREENHLAITHDQVEKEENNCFIFDRQSLRLPGETESHKSDCSPLNVHPDTIKVWLLFFLKMDLNFTNDLFGFFNLPDGHVK